MLFKKYYCIKQHDSNDCAAACLATIVKQNGLQISIAKIRDIAGTDTRGTNVYGVIKAAEQLGFSTKAVRGNKEGFFSPFPLPCIAHVTVKGNLQHYVVIHKITKNKIIIADPGEGIVKLTPEEFFGEQGNENNPATYSWSGVLVLLITNQQFANQEKDVGIFKRFFHLLLPQKKYIINVFIASILYTILGILGAFYFQLLLDSILPAGTIQTLHIVTIGVILLNLFQVLLNAFRSHLLLYLSQKLDIALLLGYYDHALSLSMNFFGTRKAGEIISRFNDAFHVRDAISGVTLTIMIDTSMVIIGGIILFNQNSYMFGVALVIVLFYLIIVWGFNGWYRTLNRELMENNAQLTSYLFESINGIQTIKAYAAESEAKANTEKNFITLLRSVFKLSWVSNLQDSLKRFLEMVGGITILWVGAISVINGNITIGQLITFNALLVYFLGPLKNLINLQPMLHTAVAAAERLGEILDLEPEKKENEARKLSPSSIAGDIEMKEIWFRYGTRKYVLEDISLKISQGEKIAFVGESGSGKTTLVKLLLNLYSPEKGEILINGWNIKDIQLDSLRSKIAYVPQETFLFGGTIMENLTFGNKTATTEQVIEATKMAQAHDFINDFPFRYETILDENGANLSGGQRQRLALARAILKKPDILILDEATSNLDSITERAIEQTINEYSEGITTLIIAHRLSTIKRCDKIYITDKGKFVESGTHEKLLEARGFYYRLVQAQSLNEG